MRNLSRIAPALVLIISGLAAPVTAQTTTRVSVATGGGQANSYSHTPVLSADGRYVAFESEATNLVAGDTNGFSDVFVHDRVTGVTERVSLGASGVQGNAESFGASISADGRYVLFDSAASNLIPFDTNNTVDVFVRDRQTATTIRVSVGTWLTPAGVQGNNAAKEGVISGNGRYVAFTSYASNMVTDDTNGVGDVFLRDLQTGQTVRVSVSSAGAQTTTGHSTAPVISSDGQTVTFESLSTNLVGGDTNGKADIFVRDVAAGKTTRVSVGPGGVQGNAPSTAASISGDGRFVVFESAATTFDAQSRVGVFIHDRQSGVTSPLSVVATPGVMKTPKISGDGRFVCVEESPGSLVSKTLVINRKTRMAARADVTLDGGEPENPSVQCVLNDDGTIAGVVSAANNLVANDTNKQYDVFVRTMPSNAAETMTLDKTAFTFGAVTSGGTFLSNTAAQIVRLAQSAGATVQWTAVSNQPWLHVSPASGMGSATLSISVAPSSVLPSSGTVTGRIFLSFTGAANTVPPIDVSLTLVPAGTAVAPFGSVDSPADNRTGVTGAVPFTGWALDDTEVTRVSICRAAFGSEVAPVDPNCGGATEIFVGFAVFIDGARPDVAAAFSTYPMATRAGWGFMVLTNMLPGQGNGTYAFRMRAQDREGNWILLGTRTMTCANASATLPFGTLDTPVQGGVASGSAYVNFGWALTPQTKTIPVNGSTIHVLVDGIDVGTVDYNHARSDIQTLFPGLNNTNGAIGFRILDTTTMINGLHTISWTVTDNAGAVEGLGSRFFTIANSGEAVVSAAQTTDAHLDVSAVPLDATPLSGRRGWDLDAPYESLLASASGVMVVRSEEVSRIELKLGEGEYSGYLRTPAGLAPLPIGSRLDTPTNTFTWAPGVGFVGRYDLVFLRSIGGRAVSRREVRVILYAKGRGAVGPQVVIDLPKAHAIVQQPFMIGGWAADLDAALDTGVATIHAWAYPSSGGAPIFLGAMVYGGVRADVAAVHGDQFKDSGFGLIVQGLAPGDYDLALFAWSTERVGFVTPKTVRISVAALRE